MGAFQNLVGLKFNRLTPLERVFRQGKSGTFWRCACECGNESVVNAGALKTGRTKSCGCLDSEILVARNKAKATHGLSQTPEYAVWNAMIRRCTCKDDKFYHRYGALGITVHPDWLNSFETFLADMGARPSPKHTLDRVDNKEGYSKGNCRWATQIDQANNRSSNRTYTHLGRTQTLSQWCRELDKNLSSVTGRMDLRGMTFEEAVNATSSKFVERKKK